MSVGERDAVQDDPSGTEPGGDGAAGADGGEGGEAAPPPDPLGGDGAASAEAPAPEQEPVVELTPEQREIAALKEELAQGRQAQEQATARLRAVSKAYTDLQAEMKAFRERMEHRVKLDAELQAFEQVKVFFEPVMNLRRSLAAPGGDEESLRTGLRMIEQQFMEALHKLGLSEVPGIGSRFDPNVHEAIAVTPVDDPAQDGVVLVVHTAGYAVGSRVLQAAQVVIGKHEEAVGEA